MFYTDLLLVRYNPFLYQILMQCYIVSRFLHNVIVKDILWLNSFTMETTNSTILTEQNYYVS